MEKCFITVRVPKSKRDSYSAACKSLGTSVSAICRAALDQTILLSQKISAEKE